MYLMYVDETGDCGIAKSPGRYFVLTGVVIHELRWETYLTQIVGFRRRMREQFGLHLREEIHAGHMLSSPGPLARIPKHDRLTIIRLFADELATMSDMNLINVVVDKLGKRPDYDVFAVAWQALIQRFENTISRRNFPGPRNQDDRGMIFPDQTDTKKLMQLLRRMRRYNPVPNQSYFGSGYRNLTLNSVMEDPNFRQSDHSYFVQAADTASFLLYQAHSPNAYMKKRAGHGYFHRLDPILCTVAATYDPQGIVRL
jgi:hypothetical protein